jgi:hypothetical protein
MAKTAAQLDREIAESLAAGAPVKSSHSAKALATIAMMGTTPSQWDLTPIKWVDEERKVPGLVTCPTCHGMKFVRIQDGKVTPPPPINTHEHFLYRNAARSEAGKTNQRYGNCPTCAAHKRGWGLIPQGKVKGFVTETVKVGYPQFPAGTKFDSRFSGGLHCALCNKLIMKSLRVPVHATGDNGVTHGMFVGEDCGKKFLDVKLKRDKDSIMETGNGRD